MPTGLVKVCLVHTYDPFANRELMNLQTIPISPSIANGSSTPDENFLLSVNPLVYLPWMKTQLEERGVTFIRKKLRSIEEAAELAGPNGVLVNATGLGARSLIGVEDIKVFPKRGQTILVENSEVDDFYEDHKRECYHLSKPTDAMKCLQRIPIVS